MTIVRAHLWISGRVQGVNFRYYTRAEAVGSGITGWVRNLWDGRVEVIFEGDENAVKRMVEWCQKGPPSARVDDIRIEWETPTNSYEDFEVRMTARGE